MEKDIALTCGCPVGAAMKVIGGKYKVIIIWNLIDKTLRYNQIKKALPHVTPKMLSQQLKELEADGIINRMLYPVVPPKTEYSLTEIGRSLAPIIESLCAWSCEYYQVMGLANPYETEQQQDSCVEE